MTDVTKLGLWSFFVGLALAAWLYEEFRVPASALRPEIIRQTMCSCSDDALTAGSAVVFPEETDSEVGDVLGKLCAHWCAGQLPACSEHSTLSTAAATLEGVLEL